MYINLRIGISQIAYHRFLPLLPFCPIVSNSMVGRTDGNDVPDRIRASLRQWDNVMRLQVDLIVRCFEAHLPTGLTDTCSTSKHILSDLP